MKQHSSGSGPARYLNGKLKLVNVAKGQPIFERIPSSPIAPPTRGPGYLFTCYSPDWAFLVEEIAASLGPVEPFGL